jgi:hypothetical protein
MKRETRGSSARQMQDRQAGTRMESGSALPHNYVARNDVFTTEFLDA